MYYLYRYMLVVPFHFFCYCFICVPPSSNAFLHQIHHMKRTLALQQQQQRLGLIFDIDAKAADFFTFVLDFNASVNLLRNKKHIYNVAVESAVKNSTTFDETIYHVVQKAEDFMLSNELWNRDELKGALTDIITGNKKGGTFACVLGGKSTGKSLVLKEIEGRNFQKVLLINLRGNPDILSSLIQKLRERRLRSDKNDAVMKVISSILARTFFQSVVEKMTWIGTTIEIKDIIKNADFQTFYDTVMKAPTALASVLDEIASGFEGFTLIIDEANIALNILECTTPAEVKAVKETLAVLTKLSKEEKKLNVILVSSEHAFPFKLMNPNLSFNINDFNAFIFAGEVSPKDMYQLLTSKWGVEDSLALALIDHYGGHVWDAYLALKRLLRDKQRFKALDSSLSDSVIQCLNWKGDREGDPERMRETLRLLAVTGFCPIKTITDPIARVISANNVGGVVKEFSTIIGLSQDVWESTECENGIVPSKQSMRLAIAKQLLLMDET